MIDVRNTLIDIKCAPTKPSFITPSESSLWHAYCLGFEAGAREALRQVNIRVCGVTA